MEIETHLVVTDYLNRMCGWLSVKLSQVLNKIAPESLSLKGWRFRYVWNDELEQVKTEYPVLVLKTKRLIIINLQKKVYSDIAENENIDDHYAKEWAYAFLKLLFDIESKDPINDMFKDADYAIVEVIGPLCDDQHRFLENGIHTIDYVMPFDATTDDTLMSKYCDETLNSAIDIFDTIN